VQVKKLLQRNEFISRFVKAKRKIVFLIFSRSFFSLSRQQRKVQNGLLRYINISVISALMVHNLNAVFHILIVQQVCVVPCSAWETILGFHLFWLPMVLFDRLECWARISMCIYSLRPLFIPSEHELWELCIIQHTMNRSSFENADIVTTMKNNCSWNVRRHRQCFVTH